MKTRTPAIFWTLSLLLVAACDSAPVAPPISQEIRVTVNGKETENFTVTPIRYDTPLEMLTFQRQLIADRVAGLPVGSSAREAWAGRLANIDDAIHFERTSAGNLASAAHNNTSAPCFPPAIWPVISEPFTGIFVGDRTPRQVVFNATSGHRSFFVDNSFISIPQFPSNAITGNASTTGGGGGVLDPRYF